MKKIFTIFIFTSIFILGRGIAQDSCINFSHTPAEKTIDCSDTPVFDVVTAVDGCCSNSLAIVNFIDIENNLGGCLLSIKRTWIAVSDCGSEEISQTINFVDNEKPVFVINHPDLSTVMSGDTLTKECQDGFFVGVGDVTATDNCDDNPSVLMYDDLIDGSCPNDGFTELLYCYWVASDVCYNKDTFEIYIKFIDIIDPLVFCPDDVTIDCQESIDPDNTGFPTAEDNCTDFEDLMIMYEDVEEEIDPCTWKITRTWIIMDECGNEDTCEQEIWLLDLSPPEIVCPNNVIIDCDETLDPSNTGMATATDACSTVDTLYFSDLTEPVNACEYILHRTWIAVDICGNSSTCAQMVTVKDLTAPEITCPDDISLECGDTIDPTNTGYSTATDNCTNTPDIIITYSDDSIQINSCELIIERTWTADDNCGNLTSCVQLIKITDTLAPEISCPDNVTIECSDSLSPNNTGHPTASEICDLDVEFTFIDEEEVFDCETIVTRKWTATDDCGNATICEQMITVSDFTAPEIVCPDNITVECNSEITPDITGNPSGTDNCDTDLDYSFTDQQILANDCEILVNRSWTAFDNCNNESDCSQLINITDTTPPELNCPADATVECMMDSSPASTGEATGSDSCDDSVEISYNDVTTVLEDCTTTIERTWSATNDCGLVTECVQIITITDQTPPAIMCPDDVTIECNTDNSPIATGEPTATDNCDTDLDFNYNDVETTINNCESNIERTWETIDNCGNIKSCVQIITIVDTTAPEISCPDDVTVECNTNNSPFATGEPTSTDNCSMTFDYSYSDVNNPIDDCSSEIARTWLANDGCDNISSCVQIITITDTTAPTINCPQPQTVECNMPYDPTITGEPFAFDNCDGALDISFTDAEFVVDDCTTEITRTWSAVDNCGNEMTCDQLITINDSNPPAIICPEDASVECNTDYSPAILGEVTTTDNCDSDLEISNSDAIVSDDGCEQVVERTWLAIDNCGNEKSCVQTINITDTTLPEIACPDDISISCEQSSDPSITGMPTASDNCDVDLSVTYIDDTLSADICQIIIDRKWTAVDNCGNGVLCNQMITIEDNAAPIITCPSDATLECSTDNSPFNQGFATAVDNCGTDPTVTWIDVPSDIDDCNSLIERIWTATDDCGNQAICQQFITITDTTPPINTCPQHLTISCEDSIAPSATGEPFAFDNCDPTLNIIYDDVVTNDDGCTSITERTWSASDDCGNVSTCVQFITMTDSENPLISCPDDVNVNCDMPTDPSNTGEATATDNCGTDLQIEYSDAVDSQDGCEIIYSRNWTATDNCGNVGNCVQSVSVTDNSDPEIECPADISISCEESSDPSVTGMPDAFDNCDMDLSVTYVDDTLSQDVCQTIIERKWTATDDCGNAVLCNQMITIEDTSAPVITCPADLTVSCNDDTSVAATGEATGTDNCDADLEIYYQDEDITVDDCTSQIKRTFSAADDCGLMGSCSQYITLTDTETPVIYCPDDVIVECNDDIMPNSTGEATATDNCDSDINITYDDATNVLDDCTTNIERNWMALDNCGNVGICSQNITVTDFTAPSINCPDNLVVNCGAPTDPANTGNASATDNCDSDIMVTYMDSELPGTCGLSVTRTWMAVDNCGNADMCPQTIEVMDIEGPTINCPQNISVECNDATDVSATGEPFAFDNCDPVLDIAYEDMTNVIDDCNTEITRTWSATDECDNVSYCDQIITVTDLTGAEITCPSDLTIECTMSAAPQITGSASGSDNCDNDIDITYSDDTTQIANCHLIITRTWTAVDDCGNETNCDQIITVTDSNAPSISFNNPILTNYNDCDTLEMECGTEPTFTEADAMATDICDMDVDISVEVSSQSGDCLTDGFVEIITYNFIATDDCDNADTIKISIRTIDTTAPVISPTDPGIAGAMDGDTLTIDCENFWFLDESAVSAVDDCGAATVTFEEEIYQHDCTVNGLKVTLTCSWIAEDNCNNIDTFTLVMNIVDNTAPTIADVPADISVLCVDVPPVPTLTASDGCDGSPTLEFEETEYINSINDCGIIRTWTATDECGNTTIATQYITILDCDGCFTPNVAGFVSFDATNMHDGTVMLDWEFTAVSHNHLFIVQRSADNTHFEDIAIVPGVVVLQGDSDFYEYMDETPRRGNNYYRIKSVQANPSSFVSNTNYIRMDEEAGVNILVYPNPTSNYINVEILGDLDKEVDVQVVNEFGQVVLLERVPVGTVLKSLDLTEYPEGVYFVTVLNFRNKFVTHRIIKMD